MSDQHPSNPSSLSKLLATMGTGSIVLAAALVIAVNSGVGDSIPQAVADPETPTVSATPTSATSTSTTPTSTTSTSTTSTTPTTTTSSTNAKTYPADPHGYVDTAARCEESQSLMAYGRTERALVAICVDPDGALEYRGVRLSDNASLQLPVNRGTDGTLIASNDTVTYSISPSMLLVSDGDSVIYRDSWLEYKEPNFSGTSTSTPSSTPSSEVATTTVTATPTTSVSTTTVTVTTTPPKPAS